MTWDELLVQANIAAADAYAAWKENGCKSFVDRYMFERTGCRTEDEFKAIPSMTDIQQESTWIKLGMNFGKKLRTRLRALVCG